MAAGPPIERLYAVGPAFPLGLESEAFRASLLGHETQHFADLQQFPALQPVGTGISRQAHRAVDVARLVAFSAE